MGEVSETAMTMTAKKKKKGRPSLFDLQIRSLKQQQQQQQQQHQNQNRNQQPQPQNPNSLDFTSNPNSRSSRRKPNLNSASPAQDWIYGVGDEDDDDERKEKKQRPLLGFNSNSNSHYPTLSLNSLSFNSVPNGSDSNADGDDPEVALKRRKLSPARHGSIQTNQNQKVLIATDSSIHGSQVESGPTTPLPDKKLLVFILDRLQKKDTYGVFSEPVDPEELPDYHDIVENPMDFQTVRKKLDEGAYSCLEHFENDVFLICTNAMQYNASDTIYFRQARSIQELAKKDFENLRQNGNDCQPQPKKRGRPPGKSLKKSIERSPVECVGPESLSDTTLASKGEKADWSNSYNLRKGSTTCKLRPADALNGVSHGSINGETCTSWLFEWENEFPASVLRSVMKYGKKQFPVDENRRNTYGHSLASGHVQTILDAHEGERKELMPVGPYLEYGYARSLARFAAGLGPAVWGIASKKLGSVLPIGVKFGPGWIGEDETPQQQQSLFSEKSLFDPMADDHKSRLLSPSTSVSNSVAANRSFLQSREDLDTTRRLNTHNQSASLDSNVGCSITPLPPFPLNQDSTIKSGVNDLQSGNVAYAQPQKGMFNPAAEMLGMVSSSNTTICRPVPRNDIDSNEAKLSITTNRSNPGNMLPLGSSLDLHRALQLRTGGEESWQPGLSMNHRQDFYHLASDLNVRFQAPGSPGSIVQIGSPQQPDLALQL